jgi:hypothetical protein
VAVAGAEEVDVRREKTAEIDVRVDFCPGTGFDGIGVVGNEIEVGMELVEEVDVGEGIARWVRDELRSCREEMLDIG